MFMFSFCYKSLLHNHSAETVTNYQHIKAKDYLTQELKQLLNDKKNGCIQTFLQDLTPTESTDYSLWKATKKLKQATS
jgi:hypothetical protein